MAGLEAIVISINKLRFTHSLAHSLTNSQADSPLSSFSADRVTRAHRPDLGIFAMSYKLLAWSGGPPRGGKAICNLEPRDKVFSAIDSTASYLQQQEAVSRRGISFTV